MAETEKKRTPRVPHVYTIILVLMAVFAVLTWVVPSGSFERQEVNGREVTVSGTYEPVDRSIRTRTATRSIFAKASSKYLRPLRSASSKRSRSLHSL